MIRKTALAALIASATLGLMACEKEGPAERMGEEVDEAVNTMKNGGEETPGDKLDDAGDKMQEAAQDVGDAVKDK
jgi:hypothetical protein